MRISSAHYMNEANFAVKDLTLGDVMRMPLKAGLRPPLLVDVLRSAMAIGGNTRLVIEVCLMFIWSLFLFFVAHVKINVEFGHESLQVKPGNAEIVEPLMMLFKRHPALLSRVAVIMVSLFVSLTSIKYSKNHSAVVWCVYHS